MTFTVNPALLNNTIEVATWPLSKVLFKNECQFAWFLLIPQQANLRELFELSDTDQVQLMREITQLSKIIQVVFQPDKLNVATIGNKTPQLHIHVVGRFRADPLWPESIWQASYSSCSYNEKDLTALIAELSAQLTPLFEKP